MTIIRDVFKDLFYLCFYVPGQAAGVLPASPYTHTHAHTHTHTHTHTRTQAHAHTHTYTCTRTCTHTHEHTHTHTNTHARTHTHIHTRTHTHTQRVEVKLSCSPISACLSMSHGLLFSPPQSQIKKVCQNRERICNSEHISIRQKIYCRLSIVRCWQIPHIFHIRPP